MRPIRLHLRYVQENMAELGKGMSGGQNTPRLLLKELPMVGQRGNHHWPDS